MATFQKVIYTDRDGDELLIIPRDRDSDPIIAVRRVSDNNSQSVVFNEGECRQILADLCLALTGQVWGPIHTMADDG